MLAKIEFHEIDSWNLVEFTSEMYAIIIQRIGGINSGLSVCMLLWDGKNTLFEARKTAKSGFKDSFDLMQSTPNNSL
jgi:hypothetical protein